MLVSHRGIVPGARLKHVSASEASAWTAVHPWALLGPRCKFSRTKAQRCNNPLPDNKVRFRVCTFEPFFLLRTGTNVLRTFNCGQYQKIASVLFLLFILLPRSTWGQRRTIAFTNINLTRHDTLFVLWYRRFFTTQWDFSNDARTRKMYTSNYGEVSWLWWGRRRRGGGGRGPRRSAPASSPAPVVAGGRRRGPVQSGRRCCCSRRGVARSCGERIGRAAVSQAQCSATETCVVTAGGSRTLRKHISEQCYLPLCVSVCMCACV